MIHLFSFPARKDTLPSDFIQKLYSQKDLRLLPQDKLIYN